MVLQEASAFTQRRQRRRGEGGPNESLAGAARYIETVGGQVRLRKALRGLGSRQREEQCELRTDPVMYRRTPMLSPSLSSPCSKLRPAHPSPAIRLLLRAAGEPDVADRQRTPLYDRPWDMGFAAFLNTPSSDFQKSKLWHEIGAGQYLDISLSGPKTYRPAFAEILQLFSKKFAFLPETRGAELVRRLRRKQRDELSMQCPALPAPPTQSHRCRIFPGRSDQTGWRRRGERRPQRTDGGSGGDPRHFPAPY